jgi:hypothetical protein
VHLSHFINSVETSAFNNSASVSSFVETFEAAIMSLNPNVHPKLADITPNYEAWKPISRAELLFNMTFSGRPMVHPIATDPGVLLRGQ